MCGYFCIAFINFRFKAKTLSDYTNLLSPNNFLKNDDIIMNYFMKNVIVEHVYLLKNKKQKIY